MTTALHRSAFALLGATTRDNRRRIVQLADEKSLVLDQDECLKARSELTTPRTRVHAEMAWLPGVSPQKAEQLLENLSLAPMSARSESGLPPLAHLNLMAAAFDSVDRTIELDDLVKFITETARLVERLDPEVILRRINEDRAVSGFPEVQTLSALDEALRERKQYYRTTIRNALDRLPALTLIRVMTDTVYGATFGATQQAPQLIDDLVDSYAVETLGALEQESENAAQIVATGRQHIEAGQAAVSLHIDTLDRVLRNWVMIAKPIQMSSKARGIDHEASHKLAYDVRSFAIDLFNQHDMVDLSRRLTSLLQDLFSDVPEIADRVQEDAAAIIDITKQRKQAAEREDAWTRDIAYSVEIGAVFKNLFCISVNGVSWKNQNFPLESITRVRWGGIRQSSGTTYTVAFGDPQSEAVVTLRKEDIYTKIIGNLWKAVGVRIVLEMLQALKDGRDLHFGDALLHDDGITLVQKHVRSQNQKVRYAWHQIQVWIADGSFYIADKEDRRVYTALSYIYVANTHILEHAIRMAFEKPGLRRLSDLLS